MEKEPCGACGATVYRFWRLRLGTNKDGTEYREESCDQCRGVRPSYARDAAGGKVTIPNGYNKYSYAIDAPITGARSYAEHLQKAGLAIKE